MNTAVFRRWLVNKAWIATCASKYARFTKSLHQVEQTQTTNLMRLMRRNEDTAFGRQHAFRRINSVSDYQQAVPVAEYADFSTHIEAIALGQRHVLTSEPVKLFHPTSGSQSATKLIPWTSSLADEFQQGIAPWVTSLYSRNPAIMKGRAYWSVSPRSTPSRTHGSMRVGFDGDSDYLGALGKSLFSHVSVVTSEVANCSDVEQFKLRTLVALLETEDLTLISVWSPTFLTILLEELMRRPDEILNELAKCGRGGAKQRGTSLARFLKGGTELPFEKIWPNLQVISCWTHAASEIYADNLRRYFPNVEMQAKGLLATEAFVSLPVRTDLDPVLAVTSHFYEFCDVITGEIRLAHELSERSVYSVIVTTGGGLYRYKLGDLVRVTGFLHQAPCLRFVGRQECFSDLFGEKLNGSVVEELIKDSLSKLEITARFFLLAPTLDSSGRTAYTLFLDADRSSSIAGLQRVVEQGLSSHFHYSHCRQLGQLAELRIFHVHRELKCPEDIFMTEIHRRGQKLGDIKMVALDAHLGWDQRFSGGFV